MVPYYVVNFYFASDQLADATDLGKKYKKYVRETEVKVRTCFFYVSSIFTILNFFLRKIVSIKKIPTS